MRRGFERNPIKEVIGRLGEPYPEPNNFGKLQVKLPLTAIKVLDTETYTTDTETTIAINYPATQDGSVPENSAWGLFGVSAAKALGVTIENLELTMLANQTVHLRRHDNHSFGVNRQTGQPMLGPYWELVHVVQPGETYEPKASVPPVVSGGSGPTAVAPNSEEAYARALYLLGGKTRGDFFNAALSDEGIKADIALVQGIASGSFIQGLLDTGAAVEQGDGTYALRKG